MPDKNIKQEVSTTSTKTNKIPKELIMFPDKYKNNEKQFYNDYSKFLQNKYDVTIDNNSNLASLFGGIGLFNPFNDKIYYKDQYNRKDKSPGDVKMLLTEIPHKLQKDKYGTLKLGYNVIKDRFKYPDNIDRFMKSNEEGGGQLKDLGVYMNPGSIEYEAHSIIEPKLKEDFKYRYNEMKKFNKYQNGGQLGSTLGSIGGMALGSIIAPGVGTTIGGMLGGKAGNFVQNQFMNGGKLQSFVGPKHSEGGIQLTDNQEVEGGESKINDFVFSNNLLYGKKQTFADKSKSIDKKYFRDNDKIDAMGKKLELEQLANQQENMKKSMIMSGLSSKYMNGGKLKKKYIDGGTLTDEQMAKYPDLYNQVLTKRKLMNELKPSNAMTPDDGVINLDSSTDPILSSPTISKNSGLSTPTFNSNAINPNITSNITDPKTMDVFSNKPNYGNILPQLTGDAFNIIQGVKGGDPVDFQRVNSYLANPRPAIASLNNATSTSFNSAKNAIRNNATSSGEYLAQMNSLAGAESLKRGVGIAGIKAEYDKMNTGIMNQTASQNAGIQMQESIARQQETDAARSAVSKGLSDMGSKIGSINNEKNARINQKDLVSLMSKNGYKLTRDANGELGFEKNGTFTPYEFTIDSVLGTKK